MPAAAKTSPTRASFNYQSRPWQFRGRFRRHRRSGSTTRWASCRGIGVEQRRCVFGGTTFRPAWAVEARHPRDPAALAARPVRPPRRRRARVALPGLAPAVQLPRRRVPRDRRQPQRRGDPRRRSRSTLRAACRSTPDATSSTSISPSGTRTARRRFRSAAATRSATSTTATAAATPFGPSVPPERALQRVGEPAGQRHRPADRRRSSRRW